MAVSAGEKTTRAGSATKRAAILVAARDLFLRDGVERTSMDAIAARAAVSKRTVYDYYGDKARLLRSVVDAAADSLLASLHAALAKHLPTDSTIGTAEQLEQALTAFAIEVGTTVITSTDYATVFTLIAEQRAELIDVEEGLLRSTEPETAIAEHLAHFHDAGLIDAPDPHVAADHFNALTILLAYNNQTNPARADPGKVGRIMTEGVRAFMRAYASHS